MPRPLVSAALVLLAAFLLASAPAIAAGSSNLGRISDAGKLRVGMTGNQPPMNFLNTSGEWRGFEVDLARGLAMLMGVELEIVEMPFGGLVGALESGKLDMVMSGMSITPERNMKVAFVGPYFLSGKSILTRSSTLAQAQETADLDKGDITLAALAGSTSQMFVETLLPSAKLVTTENYDEAVALLLADKVTAVVADFEICALSTFLHPNENLVALGEPLTIEPYGIAVPPNDGLLLNFLENSLGALEASGLLERLAQRWMGSGDWVTELPGMAPTASLGTAASLAQR